MSEEIDDDILAYGRLRGLGKSKKEAEEIIYKSNKIKKIARGGIFGGI